MKRYLTIVVCAAACLLSSTAWSQTELKLRRSTTDEQLAQKVKGLTTLKSLDLSFCRKITDAGLVHLKGLTTLKVLSLGGCDKITDAGLAHPKGLTKLEYLSLNGCDKITDAAVSKLKKALPNCKITR